MLTASTVPDAMQRDEPVRVGLSSWTLCLNAMVNAISEIPRERWRLSL